MPPEGTPTAALYELIQETYFDSIDAGDAESAVTALHEDVEWVHT
jgi:ketosteroid isomerase-like protein